MGRYLNERELGVAQDEIGFPNIGDCMGVVLLTTNEMFGFHAMPGDSARVTAMANFIGTKLNTAIHLYGTCIRKKRYDGDNHQWLTEMQAIAAGLNYHGPASGFDLPAYPNNKDGTNDTTYLEYRRSSGATTCDIYYKRMSKMQTPSGPNFTTDPVERVLPGGPTGFKHVLPNVAITTKAEVIETYWNKGELHEVPESKIETITIP
jgi:hypothetical protein